MTLVKPHSWFSWPPKFLYPHPFLAISTIPVYYFLWSIHTWLCSFFSYYSSERQRIFSMQLPKAFIFLSVLIISCIIIFYITLLTGLTISTLVWMDLFLHKAVNDSFFLLSPSLTLLLYFLNLFNDSHNLEKSQGHVVYHASQPCVIWT